MTRHQTVQQLLAKHGKNFRTNSVKVMETTSHKLKSIISVIYASLATDETGHYQCDVIIQQKSYLSDCPRIAATDSQNNSWDWRNRKTKKKLILQKHFSSPTILIGFRS